MPELPEVETTCRALSTYMNGKLIETLHVRDHRLRWPIPEDLGIKISGLRIDHVERRAKYIIVKLEIGALIMHMGMSGSWRLVSLGTPINKHEHVDIQLNSGWVARYKDPRRFGSILWSEDPWTQHPLICKLGVEPLSDNFTGNTLFLCVKNKKTAIKPFIMSSKIVVGVGNIYATEALFLAKIDPRREANSLSETDCYKLVQCIKKVLLQAIKKGGTTLQDFVSGTGAPGYFQQELLVYGRGGHRCLQCGAVLQQVFLAQRSSVFCPECQG